jgi:nickel/cobalt transporter (NicO) family protein
VDGANRRGSTRSMSRRATALAALGIGILTAVLVLPTPARAHPLGNFSVNHQTRVQISSDRVQLLYILDQAEIPTFQERGLSNAEILRRKLEEVRRNLWLIVDGRRHDLRLESSPRLTFPPGQAGLRITRLELPFVLRVKRPRAVEVRDLTFEDRVGWVDLVSIPGHGTAVETAVSPRDPTNALRTYKGITLKGVPDQVRGQFAVQPGRGSVLDLNTGTRYGAGDTEELRKNAPYGAPEPGEERSRGEETESSGGFASVFDDAAQGKGVFLLLLLAAFAWGALHALSPGHGKTMVAAYLVGTRGTARHAVALGAVVTVTHTIGVFALGLVTLLLAQYILPEDLYPWLNLAAGVLILAVGVGVLRSRIRWGRRLRAEQGHAHEYEHGHRHGDHDHHHPDPDTSWKGITAMGVSAGIIPCPTALVVLLAAISQHEVGLGLLLISVFSIGLAATLTVLGLAVVHGKRLMERLGERVPLSARVAAVLPALSTLVILGLGIVLTVKAVPGVL